MAHAFHAVRATAIDRTGFTTFYSYRNFLTTWVKNMPARFLLRYLMPFVFHQFFVSVRFLFRRERGAYFGGLLDFIKRLPQTLRDRRLIQQGANTFKKEDLMLDSGLIRILLDSHRSRQRLDGAAHPGER